MNSFQFPPTATATAERDVVNTPPTDRDHLAEALVQAFAAADEALLRIAEVEKLLSTLPDEQVDMDDDDEIVALFCDCRTQSSERRVERITRRMWRTLAGVCMNCRGQIRET